MSNPRHEPADGDRFCVSFPCDFAAGRAASRQLCEFLGRCGVPEADLFTYELALAEACNNAVQHVGNRGRGQAVEASVRCLPDRIEIQVTDHTDGFEWPTHSLRPPPPDAEHGRGIFIIQSSMDGAAYARGAGANTLTMWKARRPGA